MRLLFAVALLSLSALAEPSIRWIDETGGFHEEPLARVESESVTGVVAILKSGKRVEIAGTAMIGLVREDEQDVDQARLLEARLALAAGLAEADRAKLLDRLAADGKQDWIREYAAATRALLAQRLDAKDTAKRLDAFLEKYPDSRFVPHILTAKMFWVATRPGADDSSFVDGFLETAEKIHKRGASIYELNRCLLESSRCIRRVKPEMLETHIGYLEGISYSEKPSPDRSILKQSFSSLMWVELLQLQRDEIMESGRKPYGPRRQVARLAYGSGLLLPEVQAEIHLALARLELDVGHEEAAAAALKKALEVVRNPYRRAVVESRLKELKR